MAFIDKDEDGRPENIPDIKWGGRMVPGISDFITSCVAAGWAEVDILNKCKDYFGGPNTLGPIKRIKETHAGIITEKIQRLSKEISNIPIAHKTYRIKLLNNITGDLLNRWRFAVEGGDEAAGIEKLGRTLLRSIDAARQECEGSGDITMVQQNVYIEEINALDPSKLDALADQLESARRTFDDILTTSNRKESEIIDAVIEEVEDEPESGS